LTARRGLATGAAILALAVAGCSDDSKRDVRPPPPPIKLTHRLSVPRSGVAVRYPGGWRATTRNDTYVTNPALCFAVRHPGRQVEVKLVEYLEPALERKPGGELDYQRRPARFDLARFWPSDASWTRGRAISFQQRRRVFFIGVEPLRRLDEPSRRTVEAILNSLKVSAGRCPYSTRGSPSSATPEE
jgi:hypothetical protein